MWHSFVASLNTCSSSRGRPRLRVGMSSDRHREELPIGRDVIIVQAQDYFLPLRPLSQVCGLSPRTLRSYLDDPVDPLPHFRPGGKVVVLWSEFRAWFERF